MWKTSSYLARPTTVAPSARREEMRISDTLEDMGLDPQQASPEALTAIAQFFCQIQTAVRHEGVYGPDATLRFTVPYAYRQAIMEDAGKDPENHTSVVDDWRGYETVRFSGAAADRRNLVEINAWKAES